MPRPLRPIDDHLIYHVINRGNNRAPVFHEDEDYAAFLRAIGDLKQRRPFAFYGYCLMPNHVHLLIRPHETPISGRGTRRHPALVLVGAPVRCLAMGRRPRHAARPGPDHPPPRPSPQDTGRSWAMKDTPEPYRVRGECAVNRRLTGHLRLSRPRLLPARSASECIGPGLGFTRWRVGLGACGQPKR